MPLATHTDLVATIRDYLVGHAISDAMAANFIALAEAEFARTLRIRQQVKRAVATLTDGYTVLPPDYLSAINMTLAGSTGTTLRQITPDYADLVRVEMSNQSPAYFCIVGNTLECLPNPVGPTPVELEFYARIPALVSRTRETNALLTIAPDLYLNAALAQAAVYVADPQRAQFWRAETDRLIAQLNADSASAEYGASPLLMRNRRTIS